MKITVCLKEVIDSRLDLGFGRVSEALFRKGLANRLNRDDAGALAQALSVWGIPVEITVISIGGERAEDYLREALAQGGQRAVLIPEEELPQMSPFLKAKVLAKAIGLYGADLVLTGNRSEDNASGLTGPLMAAMLGLPCVCGVTEFAVEDDSRSVTVVRNIGGGAREEVRSTLPAVLAIQRQKAELPYASIDKLLESQIAVIDRVTLSTLGITPFELKADPVKVTKLSLPRPATRHLTYDSSLPAFERILALLQGTVSRRAGKILRGDKEELIDQLFDLLKQEDIIRPASPSSLRADGKQ